MSTGWKYSRPLKEKLMVLEEPGKPLPFDAARGLVDEVTAQCDIKALVDGLKGKDSKAAQEALEAFGKRLMNLTIELGDSKYMDRTGEMIEKVAKQTGVSFPHRFERYVELSILASRPTDRWNIAKATPKELVLQVSSCSMPKLMEEAGLKDIPCHAMCLASFAAAAEKTGDKVNTEIRKTLAKDGMCEFVFSV